MDWITMSCVISYLRWGSKLGSNSDTEFHFLWAELWHAARINQLSPFLEVGSSRIWNRDGGRGKSVPLGCTGMLCCEVFGARQWVRADCVLVCVSSCAAWVQPPGGACSALGHCSAEKMWHFALPKLGLLALKNFHCVRWQQQLSGQEFQLNTASAAVVWCGVVGLSHVPCTGCGNRALLPGFGGASAEHLGRGSAGRKGWMEHSAHQCVKKNVKNLHRRMVLPSQ